MDFEEYYLQHHPTEFDDVAYWWHPRNQIAVAYRHQLERAILWALGVITEPIESVSILDVGCGSGAQLRFFIEAGASRELVHGVDILEPRVARAHAMNPLIDIRCLDADDGLPFGDGTFDIVTQFVAFSSMLDHGVRRRVAHEMLRVLKPQGWVLSYDTTVRKPGEIPDGLGLKELTDLFPGVDWVASRKLHNRGLAKLARFPFIAEAVERVPGVPKTNLLAVGHRTS